MGKIKWVKPSGLKIQTNDKDETVEYCKSLGWKKENGRKPGRPKSSGDGTSKPDASSSETVTESEGASNR